MSVYNSMDTVSALRVGTPWMCGMTQLFDCVGFKIVVSPKKEKEGACERKNEREGEREREVRGDERAERERESERVSE